MLGYQGLIPSIKIGTFQDSMHGSSLQPLTVACMRVQVRGKTQGARYSGQWRADA